MITVTFTIKPHLAMYMYVRYGQSSDTLPGHEQAGSRPRPLHLSSLLPVYHLLHQLSVPHPASASWRETGNICLELPKPRYGKNPEVYNYIGHDSAVLIERAVDTEMKMMLYEYLLENKFNNGVMFKKSLSAFVELYHLTGLVEEESLMRGFQRWRKKMKVRNDG